MKIDYLNSAYTTYKFFYVGLCNLLTEAMGRKMLKNLWNQILCLSLWKGSKFCDDKCMFYVYLWIFRNFMITVLMYWKENVQAVLSLFCNCTNLAKVIKFLWYFIINCRRNFSPHLSIGSENGWSTHVHAHIHYWRNSVKNYCGWVNVLCF